MDTLLRIGLSNAVAATLLALIVLALSRFCRRPALVHGLWVLVLLKLVTPPLINVSFTLPAWAATEIVRSFPEPAALASLPTPATPEMLPPPLVKSVEENEARLPAAEWSAGAAAPSELDPLTKVADAEEAGNVPEQVPHFTLQWKLLLAWLWPATSLLYLTLAAARIARFQWLLRRAQPGPDWLQDQAEELAKRLGLARGPRVSLLPGSVSPMLWTLSRRPRLLVPAALWSRLDQDQRVTLLVHELAHLRRRDHWVRGLELLATGLYWWHPIVWLARRELREVEEQCCDAWVVWALPGSARAYATALVETVDYLSEARPALPSVASGFGHVHLLKRRLTMILRGTTSPSLSWTGFLAVLGLAAVLLPFWANWAQAEPPAQEPPGARPPVEEEQQDDKPNPEQMRRQKEELERAHQALQRMQEEMARMKEQMRAAEERIRQAQERFQQLSRQGGERPQQPGQGRPGSSGDRRPEPRPGERRPEPNTGVQPRFDAFQPRFDGRPGEPQPGGQPRGEAARGDGRRSSDQPAPRFNDPERRLQEMERKLDSVLRELENLRRELRPDGGRPGVPGTPAPPRGERGVRGGTGPYPPTTPPVRPVPPAPVTEPVPPAAPIPPQPSPARNAPVERR